MEMDLLKKCQELYDELRDLSEAIQDIEKEIAKGGLLVAEDKYKIEFDLAIQLSGCYEDLMYALDKLEREKTGMDFYVNRVRTNASKLVQTEILDVY